ncbi:phosphate butyryltransferase [Caloramator proteoclasticus]|uniref:Phosphate butyryltransferase n=1 Tax=Caloramator proteoclasticus DSM 10124 TaxID=1121262 RepID=A0A1M4XPK4_9CLOT|nr:phosphate butyryltransferase [Caloramator proteoclasticus]SHE95524.1 phosphate butyryltransferase [Caloramator proteoclasticus DSM 10124]
MIRTFDEILNKVKCGVRKKIAVAVAQDEPVLEAVRDAKNMGLADAVLVGDKEKIQEIANALGINLDDFEVIDEKDNSKAAMKAVELVSTKKADMLMKGLIDTATFLRAVLDKEKGLRTGRVLSHVAVFEVPALQRILLVTDAAMNIAPDLNTKKQILENAVKVAHAIGIEVPKVAPVCAVEVVNPDMQPTLDAAALSKMNDRGQIKGCIVDGPLAIDNALSEEAAKHKGIKSPVAGQADIILVPNIETGNVMYKTLTYTANAKNGGILVGAAAPVILTSRADSNESKLYSIALACLVACL